MDEPCAAELVPARCGSRPLGRILTVTAGDDQAEIAWPTHAGQAHQVTLEPTVWRRRVHEPEMEPEAE